MAWKRPYDTKYDKVKHAKTPFKVSRSKIDFFLECPRCFWMDRRLGIQRPDTPPFNINKAVDELMKTEFDAYRVKQEPHPWMTEFGVDAVPFAHDDMDKWRANFTGVQALHEPTNLLIFGAVDDVWVTPDGQLIVVDYKATAKKDEITELNNGWHIAYKRQMEVYQWLLRQNGFTVHPTGYFVYANGKADLDGFFNKVEFRTNVIPYTGDDSWVEPTILKLKACLDQDEIPQNSIDCEYCNYAKSRTMLTLEALRKKKLASKTS